MDPRAQDVIDFWKGIGPAAWFARNDDVDARITERYATLHAQAQSGALDGWLGNARECLALIIVLDQFSRNMFRGESRAFASDRQALAMANHAIASGYHLDVEPELVDFIFLPLMHSESIVDQQRCVALMHAFSAKENFDYAVLHRRIIERFGRFPHRNPVLERSTTPAERLFLENGGFGG